MKIALLPATLLTCAALITAESLVAQPLTSTNGNSLPPVTTFAPPVAQLAPAKPVIAQPQQPVPQLAPLPAGVLTFDAESKDYTAKPGEMEAKFTFNVTNVSSSEVTVTHVQTSCGCTVAHLTYPWKIPAGSSGEIPVTMNLAGKSGIVFKSVTVHTDKGQKPLMVKTTILAPAQDAASMDLARERNRLIATQDRQSVFKGDCARCHVEPVIGKMGKDLYMAACGICHEAEHRATMVADLHTLKTTPNAELWRFSIMLGKPGTLMPAFAQAEGGPLTEPQIASLVDYLTKEFPVSKTNPPAAQGH
ncbi:MAG: DUF1573 domain-containing protein [Verrucomicrobiales bacterium]|nr:MAG: DUF1573 domain-containing protein [Verrucomicrobiales bacterium]